MPKGLLFELLKRNLGGSAAFVGGLILVLFPLHTSRQIIMHQMATLIAMVMLLASFLQYRARRFWAAYILAGTLLLTYESAYLPFLIAPVFLETKISVFLRRFVFPAIVWAGIAGGIFLVRALLGESRATEVVSGISDVLPKMIQACLMGPSQAFLALLAPVDALFHSTTECYLIFLRSVHGELRRLAGPINLQGFEAYARPRESSIVDAVKPSRLFWRLFEPDDSTQWSTLREARSYPR